MRGVGAMLAMFAIGATQASSAPSPDAVMVFFDWGEHDIRSDDRASLDRVATDYRNQPIRRLRIEGHSDRSGGRVANRRAALARAAMVGDELARRGVPRGAMTITSLGEERPLIPTEDGVREVQNRRVEIIAIP